MKIELKVDEVVVFSNETAPIPAEVASEVVAEPVVEVVPEVAQ